MTTQLTHPNHATGSDPSTGQEHVHTNEFERLLKIREAVTNENFEAARLDCNDEDDSED